MATDRFPSAFSPNLTPVRFRPQKLAPRSTVEVLARGSSDRLAVAAGMWSMLLLSALAAVHFGGVHFSL
jgi:hypothetical protein